MIKKIDLSSCDLEPVSFIGRIQSFGTLLGVNPTSQRITHVAENFAEITSIKSDVMGQRIDEVFPGCASFFENNPNRIFQTKTLSIVYKRTKTTEFYEIEAKSEIEDFAADSLISQLETLQKANSLQDLLNRASEIVFEITGLDRVMIYKFHDDLHGEVVAETTKKDVDSFLGLHYPASDIPAPARAIFLQTWVRMIADVHGDTYAIKSESTEPLDLSGSYLRAASPIHLEYLKNMHVGSTVTISIKVNDKLWGLIACHNIRPKKISYSQQQNCELVGRMISTHISEVQRRKELEAKIRTGDTHKRLVAHITDHEDISKEVTQKSPNLLDLIESQGVAAALYLEGYWASVGKIPSQEQLNSLIGWMIANHPGESAFATHELSKYFPEAEAYKEIASGMLALHIPKTEKNYIFWFKPEVVQTVKWAGNPDDKTVDETGRLGPRGSFALWNEEVSGKSVPWNSWEIDAALELRASIMAIDLKQQFEKEQRARGDAERAVRAREELVSIVSHDLKNPLGSIQMNSRLLDRLLTEGNEKIKNINDRIHRSSVVMNNLIDDILSITKMEAGYLDIEYERHDFKDVVDEVIALLGPMAQQKSIILEHLPDEFICKFRFDYGRILQVLSNIVGNAIKFTEDGGRISIKVEKCGPEFITFSIKDTGAGIPKENLEFIFDRFWQAHQTKRLGTGLGLAIVKGIVTAHRGEIWATSDLGKGTTFFIKLPMA